MSIPDKPDNLSIQLGDIIQIEAPTNSDINNHIYVVEYLDSDKINLIDSVTLDKHLLPIKENKLTDESIVNINILDHAPHKGFALQNDLTPKTWIDIHFGGDLPITITGNITNLEEDMIEIKTFPDEDTIYLDFGYKGIPAEYNIDKIIIREPPEATKPKSLTPVSEEKDLDIKIPEGDESHEDIELEVPTEHIKGQIKELLLDADQIQIGQDMGTITQIIEVPEEQKRYGIENQANDLLDELLSTIPNDKRTRSVLNNLHITIERFKQLRQEYSNFDKNGNAQMPKIQGANFKPLVEHLYNLNQKLYWILPIAKNKKKLYDVSLEVEDEEDYPDIVPLTLAETRIAENELTELFITNTDSYSAYMNKLNPYLTPYENPNFVNNLITSKQVTANITSVIDNLDDLYSSVFSKDMIRKRRFVIQKYNLGLSRLHASELTASRMTTERVPMTANDTISIRSMLTLPEPTVTFSHINLPATNILDKTSLNRHYLNYWQLLRRDTSVTTTVIDNFDTPIEFDSTTFLNDIKEFILDESLTSDDKYKKYLEVVVPKTRILFELVKKYIKGKLSLYDTLGFLEPFMIYHRDLSFQQYKEIIDFIKNRILEYKKNFNEKSRQFKRLQSFDYNVKLGAGSYMLLDLLKKGDLEHDIFTAYGFNDLLIIKEKYGKLVMSSSEILYRMFKTDNLRLYTSALAKLSIDLMNPDFISIINEDNKEFQEKLQKTDEKNDCKNYVLAKKYFDIEELTEDNGKNIYFDKKYDNTHYDILKEYKNEQEEMAPPDFKAFLIDKLTKNVGLSKEDAIYDAENMIVGKKQVKDGQYAVVEVDSDKLESKMYYYKREDDKWVRDEGIVDDMFIDTPKFFCNIQKKCFDMDLLINDEGRKTRDETCADKDLAEDLIKEQSIKEIYDEFDDDYQKNIGKITKHIHESFGYNLNILAELRDLCGDKKYKYNDQQYDLGSDIKDVDVVTSPYTNLRNLILGQSDFVKKQYDISKFINNYTRAADLRREEDEYWLYCYQTDTKLLPTFFEILSTAFIEKEDYIVTVDTICKQQGKLSDDGNAWVDKHSGYVIRNIDLDVDEGYDESGFKLQSKEIMEMDIGNAILQSSQKGEGKKIFDNPDANIINNIITTMTNFMGIDLDLQREFIISNTLITFQKTHPSEERYNEKASQQRVKGKRPLTYKQSKNQNLLIILLGYMTISIQSAIPGIRTRKTHPGCKRSFIGYPLDGSEDLTGIAYIACIAHKIKSSIEPWDAIKKFRGADNITERIKYFIEKHILLNPLIQEKLRQKRNYLLQTESDYIPIKHDINKWINFLPPLKAIQKSSPLNISADFENHLIDDLKKGSMLQYDKSNIIRGKIIYFSLAIQQLIEKVVKKEKPILTNSNMEPFLENTCCNSDEINTLTYFTEKEKSILQNNRIVHDLNNILVDMRNMGKAPYLFSPANTKLIYPVLSADFSEKTIYMAFIQYCRFNKSILIDEDLRAVCMDKPADWNITDSIDEKIKKLKYEGKNYSEESLQRLLQIINRKNIVHMDINKPEVTIIQRLRIFLEYLRDTSSPIIPDKLKTLLYNILDTYDLSLTEDSKDMTDLKNYLTEENESMENEILSFLKKHSKLSRLNLNKIVDILQEKIIDKGDKEHIYTYTDPHAVLDIESENLYRTINFVKNAIRNIVSVFPDIIMNKVDYTNIAIPRHWKVSTKHSADITNIISTYYSSLKPFYDEPTLAPLLKKIQNKVIDLRVLTDNTPFFADINKGGKKTHSIFDYRTSKKLFRYYFLKILVEYIHLKDDTDIIVTEVIPPVEEDEILTSVQLEEAATGTITELEILRGEKELLTEKIVKLLEAFLFILAKEKDTVDFNRETIMKRVNKSTDKEREGIKSYLGALTEDEREIENIMKNHRLERWSKGLQKGLISYDVKTYDQEREDMEKMALKERELGKKDFVTDMNKDIFILDATEEENINHDIEKEAYDMSGQAEDDDYGDRDGDENY